MMPSFLNGKADGFTLFLIRDVGENDIERSHQLVPVHLLADNAGSAERSGFLQVTLGILGGVHEYRDVPGFWLLLEPLQRLKAIHTGQQVIQEDQVEMFLLRSEE